MKGRILTMAVLAMASALCFAAANGRGHIIDSPEEGGGWPALSSDPTWINAAKAAWEAAYGFDPYSAQGAEVTQSGYTYLELYLNSLMEALYEKDIPVPAFDNTWRWLYHIIYRLCEFFEDAKEWLEDAWGLIKGFFEETF